MSSIKDEETVSTVAENGILSIPRLKLRITLNQGKSKGEIT